MTGFSKPKSLFVFGLFVLLMSLGDRCLSSPARKNTVFNYKVIIKDFKQNHLLPDDFWEMFKYDSKLFRYSKRPVRSLKFLDDRAKQDAKSLKLRVQAYGFFLTNIHYKISNNGNKAQVIIFPDFGPVFKIANIKVKCLSETDIGIKLSQPLKPILGKPASYTVIEAAAYIIEKTYSQQGYPNAKVIKKIEKINRKAGIATLHYSVIPGNFFTFGDTKIKVSNRLDQKFIENRIVWKKGDPYNTDKIEKTSQRLLNTQIFSYVDIQSDTKGSGGAASNTINLINDKQRLLEFGVGLSSSSMQRRNKGGFRLKNLDNSFKSIITKGAWTHFNIFGGGERLKVKIKATPGSLADSQKERNFESSLDTELMQPDVLKTDNAAIYHFKLSKEPTYVYLKNGALIECLYDVPIEIFANIRAGLSLEHARVKNFNTTTLDYPLTKEVTYTLPGIPVYLMYNSYDQPLNPSKGINISILELLQYGKINYVLDKSSKSSTLNYLDGRMSIAQKIGKTKRLVVAAWVGIKQISGLAFSKLPSDKRLYAGGINSVRGYAEQMAGPMIGNSDEPTGGRFVLESGAEFRINITSKIGIVSFLEGAKVSQYLWPRGSDKLYKGWGIGGRCYTDIGPIRLDFAFPCQKRKNIDSSMQFIISLGQAF